MFTGATLGEDKSKDELVMHTSNMGLASKVGEDEKQSTATPSSSAEVEAMEDPQDPPSPPPTTSSIPSDYFAQLPSSRSADHDHDQQPHIAHPQPILPTTSALVAGSDALASGTIISPYESSFIPLERPTPQREPSTATVLSMQSVDSNATVKQVTNDDTPQRPSLPHYPDQSYAALHDQHYPRRFAPPTRPHTSHPLGVHTFASSLHQSGVQTVGNSPATTPGAGLYSPKIKAATNEWDSPQTPGTYASPYLHPTHRQAPKETHIADVDVDPISGRKLINHYEIVDELGRGTHGKVKLGRDLQSENTHVAIKIVERYSKRRRLGKLGNPEDKVKKEIAILKKARHPNIVALLEVIDDPSRKKVYIVLEWVERGTIRWRTKAEKEIAVLEAHRFERERSGVQTGETLAEDNAIQREVARRLNRRKQDIKRSWRQARQDRDPNRGIDHYGGNEDSDDDTLSRISTTTNESSMRSRGHRKESIADLPAITPEHDGIPTPTVEEPQFLQLSEAAPKTEDLRQWAAKLIDDELLPDLHYVPCMTMSNIRVAFRDTLLGLLYLHHQGIIHRDIKPPNLLQTSDHRVKISDFGVSYLGRPVHEGETGEEISESEARDLDGEAKELAKTVGTPAFYAPELCITEQLDNPLPVTKAIDVWALGITLYCMLFARTPYVDNEFVVMRQIADEEIYLPRRRLKPVEDVPKSRPNSRSRAYSPLTVDRRSEYDIIYEDIDDDLHDLLKRLLVKDPRQRIGLADVRHHPWVVADLPYSDKWLEETDQYVQPQGSEKIEISKEDLNAAVVPLQFLERMRSGIKKIGGRILSSTRGRSTSSAGSAHNSAPPSAHSSSSTISQDVRRQSLRNDDIPALLKQQRESSNHPLAKSVAASPEIERSNQEYFNDLPPHLGPFDDFGPALFQTMSHDSNARPSMAGRSKTGFSTAGSVRTIKQSDIPSQIIHESPPASPGLPGTPRALETHSGNFSGLLGGTHRNVFQTIRERASTRSLERGRQQSVDASSISSKDAHSEPSIAISDTTAAGRLARPDLHPLDTAHSSPSHSQQTSPTQTRPQFSSAYRAALGDISRQSSTSSITSASARHGHEATPVRVYPRNDISAEDERRRVEEQHVRRLLQEVQQPIRPQSAFDDRTCPPSPDDVRSRQSSDARRISDFDLQTESYETSPTTPGAAVLPSLVSSSSDFGSAVSMSISNPSIPSALSEASSVDRTDGLPLEEVENKHLVSSWNTITARPSIREEFADEGYNPDEEALDSDNADLDSDSDSDGGLVMSRRRSAARPVSSNLSAALEPGVTKQRRGTGLSRSSKKSSRSGSNNTMKKVRTRDSIDERRRTSVDNNER